MVPCESATVPPLGNTGLHYFCTINSFTSMNILILSYINSQAYKHSNKNHCLNVTSASGPIKVSPSNAPAMTRTCLGRPMLKNIKLCKYPNKYLLQYIHFMDYN